MHKDQTLVFYNGTAILPNRTVEDGMIVCRKGIIQGVGNKKTIRVPGGALMVNAQKGFISPGYVDIHVHGGDGADFMDGTMEAVRTVARAHTRHGTTTLFPTTTTGSVAQIKAMLMSCKSAQKEWRIEHGARIAGVHFYGPYFAESKVGCHSKQGRRDPNRREYLQHFDLGIIKVATCAAELPGAEDFYKEAHKRGYLLTCGHSNACWVEMSRAFRAGVRHVDHFWCAMSSVASLRERLGNPMQGSMEQFVLMHDKMSTEVIADGCHLAPELLDFAFVMKGSKYLCLVTDANRALDMPPGNYRFGPQTNGEWIRSNGKVGLMPESSRLASSVVGMEVMVHNMKQMTRASVAEVVRMATLTPAERTGIANKVGSLEAGKQADVLILNRKLGVKRVFIGGREFKWMTAPHQ